MRKLNVIQALTVLLIMGSFFASGGLDLRLEQALAEQPLTAEARLQPFEVEAGQIASVEIKLHLPAGYKAFEDQFKLQIIEPEGFKISKLQISPVSEIFDKFSKKKKQVMLETASLTAPIEVPALSQAGEQTLKLKLTYQACTETYCLFPQSLLLDAHFILKKSPSSAEARDFFSLSFKEVYGKGLGWAFLFVFIFGLLTSLTPCVYPMIPITIAILGREAHARTRWKNFLVSLVYVSGICLTFSLLGVLAASSGALLGSFMASPWVQGTMCLVFFAMSLSMFGLFEMEAPRFLRDGILSHAKFHGYIGALISGMLAGVVASPCVGPALVGVLTFVAQSKNLWLGFWLLFAYAFGLGMIFLLLGISTHVTRLLPKSGVWMNRVKIFLGMLMLGATFYYVDIFLLSNKIIDQSLLVKIKQMASLNTDKKGDKKGFKLDTINWITYSDEALKQAKMTGRPAIIDFRADWCAACLEMEEQTFTDQGLQLLSTQFVMIKFDATQESPKLQELREKYKLVGLPTVLFINKKGQWREDLNLTEFEPASKFMERMKKLLE